LEEQPDTNDNLRLWYNLVEQSDTNNGYLFKSYSQYALQCKPSSLNLKKFELHDNRERTSKFYSI